MSDEHGNLYCKVCRQRTAPTLMRAGVCFRCGWCCEQLRQAVIGPSGDQYSEPPIILNTFDSRLELGRDHHFYDGDSIDGVSHFDNMPYSYGHINFCPFCGTDLRDISAPVGSASASEDVEDER